MEIFVETDLDSKTRRVNRLTDFLNHCLCLLYLSRNHNITKAVFASMSKTSSRVRVDPITVAKPFREEISQTIASTYQSNPPKLVTIDCHMKANRS